MGFFSKLTGSVDNDLMKSPLVGRGEVIGVQVSNTTVKVNNGLKERKVTVRLRVFLDGRQPYEAEAVQRFLEIRLPQPGAVFAVRVDQEDQSKVAVDVSTPVPVITMARNDTRTGAAWILANGTPVTVILVANQPLGLKNADGHDGHLLTITVVDGVPTPYQTKVANAVPATALPLLYPGSKLHAMLGETPNNVVVDWSKGKAP